MQTRWTRVGHKLTLQNIDMLSCCGEYRSLKCYIFDMVDHLTWGVRVRLSKYGIMLTTNNN